MKNKFTNYYKQILNEIMFDPDSVQDDFDHIEFRKNNPFMFDREGTTNNDSQPAENNSERVSDFVHQLQHFADQSDCSHVVYTFQDEINQLANYYADTTEYADIVGVERQQESETYSTSHDDEDSYQEGSECVVIHLNVSRDNQDIKQKIVLTINGLTDEKDIDIQTE